MPEGTRHVFTGRIHSSGGDVILRLKDDREWLLTGPDLARLVDQRVEVEGVRGEDNILHVTRCTSTPRLGIRFSAGASDEAAS